MKPWTEESLPDSVQWQQLPKYYSAQFAWGEKKAAQSELAPGQANLAFEFGEVQLV